MAADRKADTIAIGGGMADLPHDSAGRPPRWQRPGRTGQAGRHLPQPGMHPHQDEIHAAKVAYLARRLRCRHWKVRVDLAVVVARKDQVVAAKRFGADGRPG